MYITLQTNICSTLAMTRNKNTLDYFKSGPYEDKQEKPSWWDARKVFSISVIQFSFLDQSLNYMVRPRNYKLMNDWHQTSLLLNYEMKTSQLQFEVSNLKKQLLSYRVTTFICSLCNKDINRKQNICFRF